MAEDPVERFSRLLERASAELHHDNPGVMATAALVPTPNVIDPGDVELFFEAVDAGLIEITRGGRFNTQDRPTPNGRWGLLSRSKEGGWYNAEYISQIASYADAILRLGYPSERVLFELPAKALQLDLAILDDDGDVVVLGEAKRDNAMFPKLLASIDERFRDAAPSPGSKKRGDEPRQLAWRLWTVRPAYLWLIGPGQRTAYRCSFDPLRLEPIGTLPTATTLGVATAPPHRLPVPDFYALGEPADRVAALPQLERDLFTLLLCGPGERLEDYGRLIDARPVDIKGRPSAAIRNRTEANLIADFGPHCMLQIEGVCTDAPPWDVDHLIPHSTNVINKHVRNQAPEPGGGKVLSESYGSNDPWNLVLACGACNAHKKHRFLSRDENRRVLALRTHGKLGGAT